jgi:hypothetical protein
MSTVSEETPRRELQTPSDAVPPNPLTEIVVSLHRQLRATQEELTATRWILNGALELLHEQRTRLDAQDRLIARLHDERRGRK